MTPQQRVQFIEDCVKQARHEGITREQFTSVANRLYDALSASETTVAEDGLLPDGVRG